MTCAYDRANVGASDTASTPRSASDVVNDLHRLLETADVPGPYVLAGQSAGGFEDDQVAVVLDEGEYSIHSNEM